ncbi:MAG: RNA-binding cell elongation regulator Jag/EloR [Eubacteriales bacterium]|nr:RNA-binding cell elongation regulator Jag/EloR [Eubacteriales bacterium]
MEKTIVTTGKTIDLAIEAALHQLNLDRDSVSVLVLQQAKGGFLGFGAQPAKVQVTYEAPDPAPVAPKSALGAASRSKPKAAAPVKNPQTAVAPKAAPKAPEKKPEPPKAAAPEAPEAPKAAPAPRAPRPERKPDAPRAPRAPKAPAEPRVYTPAEPGSTEEKIEVFIKGLLEHMDSKAVPHCFKEDGSSYKVDLVGEDLGYLIGRRGDTLDAIQHLTNYTVNRGVEGHIRVNVDAERYREKREDSLRRYARKKAQQVLKARRRTTLEPMNAYERHVIHAALQDMENITTHSTGVEPNRRVVIEYVR